MARPTTALNMDRKIRDLEKDLDDSRKDNKYLSIEVEKLKNEISKNNLIGGASGAGSAKFG